MLIEWEIEPAASQSTIGAGLPSGDGVAIIELARLLPAAKRVNQRKNTQNINRHMSSVLNLCWLMIIRDYATQYLEDHKVPIEDSRTQSTRIQWGKPY